jgi:hypothetical protein
MWTRGRASENINDLQRREVMKARFTKLAVPAALLAALILATTAAVATDFPEGGPSWWKNQFSPPNDGATRTQFHSFLDDPNDADAPDYHYDGFTPTGPDVWLWDGGMLGDFGEAIPEELPGHPWHDQGDNAGVHIDAPGTMSKEMANLSRPNQFKEFFISVLWLDTTTNHDADLTLSIYAPGNPQIDIIEDYQINIPDSHWRYTVLSGKITPQVDSEMFSLTFDKASPYIDSLWVGTHCVPEPGTIAMLASGALGILGLAWRRLRR